MYFEVKAFDGTRGVLTYALEAIDEADARRIAAAMGVDLAG